MASHSLAMNIKNFTQDDIKIHHVHWNRFAEYVTSTNSCYSYSAYSWARILLETPLSNHYNNVSVKGSNIQLHEDFCFDFNLPISYMDLDKCIRTLEGIVHLVFSDLFSVSKKNLNTIWLITAALYRRIKEFVNLIPTMDKISENYALIFNNEEYIGKDGLFNPYFFYYTDSMISVLHLLQFQLYRWNRFSIVNPYPKESEVFLEEYSYKLDTTYLLRRCYYFYFYLGLNLSLIRRYKFFNPLVNVDMFMFGNDTDSTVEKIILSRYPDFDHHLPKTKDELWISKHRNFTISCLFSLHSIELYNRYCLRHFTEDKIYPYFVFSHVDLTWKAVLTSTKCITTSNAYQAYKIIEKFRKEQSF